MSYGPMESGAIDGCCPRCVLLDPAAAGLVWLRPRKKVAASTGVAPVSSGLKDPDPELLDDEAERLRGIAPITEDRDQPRSHCAARPWRVALHLLQKNTHRRPSRVQHECAVTTVWTPAGFGCGRWLIDLGSAVKPRVNLELKTSDKTRPQKRLDVCGHKKPTSGREVGSRKPGYPA